LFGVVPLHAAAWAGGVFLSYPLVFTVRTVPAVAQWVAIIFLKQPRKNESGADAASVICFF
jgi:hypothetical protein